MLPDELQHTTQTQRRVSYHKRMGAKQVDGRDNGLTAKSYGNPLGVECEAYRSAQEGEGGGGTALAFVLKLASL